MFRDVHSRRPLRRSPGTLWERLGGYSVGILASFAVATLVLSLPIVAARLYDFLQIWPALDDAAIAALKDGPPTAIVILSAGRREAADEFGGEDTVDALSLERVRYGAVLARRTGLPVMTTGGSEDLAVPLAGLLADSLERDFAVLPRWQEDRSATTEENAEFAAAILHRDGFSRVVLVTHAWHMRRAKPAFEHFGLTVIPAPTAFEHPAHDRFFDNLVPTVAAFRRSTYALHEIIGIGWYWLRYDIR